MTFTTYCIVFKVPVFVIANDCLPDPGCFFLRVAVWRLRLVGAPPLNPKCLTAHLSTVHGLPKARPQATYLSCGPPSGSSIPHIAHYSTPAPLSPSHRLVVEVMEKIYLGVSSGIQVFRCHPRATATTVNDYFWSANLNYVTFRSLH